MDTSTPNTLPTSGGSYVRNGDELQLVEQTQPAEAALATHPTAPGTAAAAPAAPAAVAAQE